MAIFVSDTFSGEVANAPLEDHVGEVGATWTVHPSYTSALLVSSSTETLFASNSTIGTGYYASGIPAGPEYNVSADYQAVSVSAMAANPGIVGRMSTSGNTFYMLRYSAPNSRWELFKAVSGTFTLLGSYSQTLTTTTYNARLEITDATKKAYIDGVERISSINNEITEAGRAGTRWFISAISQTGIRIDNFVAEDIGGGTPSITPDPSTQSQTLSSPTLTQHGALQPDGIVQAQLTSAAAMLQHWVLAVDALTQSQSITQPGLTQAHHLPPDRSVQSQLLSPGSLGLAALIAPDISQQIQLTGPVTLTQAHVLAVNGLTQAQITSAVGLAVQGTIAPAGITQQQITNAPLLQARYQLLVDSLLQAQSLAPATLSVATALAVDGVTQSQSLSAPLLSQHGVLAVDSLTQTQLLQMAAGAPVIGWLDGRLVIVAALDGRAATAMAMDGRSTTTTAAVGSITLH